MNLADPPTCGFCGKQGRLVSRGGSTWLEWSCRCRVPSQPSYSFAGRTSSAVEYVWKDTR